MPFSRLICNLPYFFTMIKQEDFENDIHKCNIKCVSITNFSIVLRWYKFMQTTKNKKLVHLDDRVKQVGGTLIIKEAKVDDSGKYLCMVNNSVGGESVETVLTVTGAKL